MESFFSSLVEENINHDTPMNEINSDSSSLEFDTNTNAVNEHDNFDEDMDHCLLESSEGEDESDVSSEMDDSKEEDYEDSDENQMLEANDLFGDSSESEDDEKDEDYVNDEEESVQNDVPMQESGISTEEENANNTIIIDLSDVDSIVNEPPNNNTESLRLSDIPEGVKQEDCFIQ